MKKWLAGMVIAGALFQTAGAATVSADTLDKITVQEEEKQSELTALQAEVAQALTKANTVNDRLNELEQEITDTEEKITTTEKEISAQKEVVEEHITQAKERLKSIQTTEMNQNVILSILESESISDLLHRAYVLVTLQSAGNEQIELAQAEYEKLNELQQTLADEKEQLVQKNEEAVTQKEALDKQVASIQQLIEENQAELARLAEQRQAEEQRIAEEKRQAEETRIAAEKRAAQEKAEAAMQAANTQTQEVSVMKTAAKETKSEPAPKKETVKEEPKEEPKKQEAPKEEPKKQEASKEQSSASSSSKTMTVSATGYSTKQPGLSTHTATGIDLRVNPKVIAVDPSVIPLGTMVEVPGYGIAIAGDTGGAIKGNRIDIHFTSVDQALSFGRRNITIKILN